MPEEPVVELDVTADISPYSEPERYAAASRRAAAQWEAMEAALADRDR